MHALTTLHQNGGLDTFVFMIIGTPSFTFASWMFNISSTQSDAPSLLVYSIFRILKKTLEKR